MTRRGVQHPGDRRPAGKDKRTGRSAKQEGVTQPFGRVEQVCAPNSPAAAAAAVLSPGPRPGTSALARIRAGSA